MARRPRTPGGDDGANEGAGGEGADAEEFSATKKSGATGKRKRANGQGKGGKRMANTKAHEIVQYLDE